MIKAYTNKSRKTPERVGPYAINLIKPSQDPIANEALEAWLKW